MSTSDSWDGTKRGFEVPVRHFASRWEDLEFKSLFVVVIKGLEFKSLFVAVIRGLDFEFSVKTPLGFYFEFVVMRKHWPCRLILYWSKSYHILGIHGNSSREMENSSKKLLALLNSFIIILASEERKRKTKSNLCSLICLAFRLLLFCIQRNSQFWSWHRHSFDPQELNGDWPCTRS